jgi:hypothetical protein
VLFLDVRPVTLHVIAGAKFGDQRAPRALLTDFGQVWFSSIALAFLSN